VYQGPLEVWREGNLWFETQLSLGLRQFHLGPRGLRWNSQLLTVRGVAREQLAQTDALALHRTGYNTLLAPVRADTATLWDAADRFGFLMLGRVSQRDELPHAAEFAGLASCLGWVVAAELCQDPAVTAALSSPTGYGQLLGVELQQAPTEPLPRGVSFLVCEESLLPALASLNLPYLVLTREGLNGADMGATAVPPGTLGWINSAG
jgi:hypothetical protein